MLKKNIIMDFCAICKACQPSFSACLLLPLFFPFEMVRIEILPEHLIELFSKLEGKQV